MIASHKNKTCERPARQEKQPRRQGFFFKEWHATLKEWEFLVQETKRKVLFRFLAVLFIVVTYFFYVAHKFGSGEGLLVTMLTWSFFVFCTPIADAGILIDFPLRYLVKVRMIYSEMAVWILATSMNILITLFNPALYDQTIVLQLFYHILSQPWPFWLIILLSAFGTFLSIMFADELVDVAEEHHRHFHRKHRMKLKLIILAAIFVFIFILYNFLLVKTGLQIPLL